MRFILTNDTPPLIWPYISSPREIQFYLSKEQILVALSEHFLHSYVQSRGEGGRGDHNQN